MAGSFQPDVCGNPFTVDPTHRAGSAVIYYGAKGFKQVLPPDNFNNNEINPSGQYLKLDRRFVLPSGVGVNPFI
jgi:hypothetical protein